MNECLSESRYYQLPPLSSLIQVKLHEQCMTEWLNECVYKKLLGNNCTCVYFALLEYEAQWIRLMRIVELTLLCLPPVCCDIQLAQVLNFNQWQSWGSWMWGVILDSSSTKATTRSRWMKFLMRHGASESTDGWCEGKDERLSFLPAWLLLVIVVGRWIDEKMDGWIAKSMDG